jgi:hypothetical protein
MSDLATNLERAEEDVAAAFAHKKYIMSQLEAAEAWVNDALRREQEARFALRAAALTTSNRHD